MQNADSLLTCESSVYFAEEFFWHVITVKLKAISGGERIIFVSFIDGFVIRCKRIANCTTEIYSNCDYSFVILSCSRICQPGLLIPSLRQVTPLVFRVDLWFLRPVFFGDFTSPTSISLKICASSCAKELFLHQIRDFLPIEAF